MITEKHLDLNIEVDVLTPGSVAVVVNSVLEFVLYQRNQIPFVYKTYKYYVAKWREESSRHQDDIDVASVPNFQLVRQRERATQTKQSISAMRELIKEAFNKNKIKCIRFLLGSSTYTPVEAYTIHIPTAAISREHLHDYHPIHESRLNQMLIKLLTSENLYNIFSKNLAPTNVFLELEMLDSTCLQNSTTTSHIFPKDFHKLPVSCEDVHINLQLSQLTTPLDSVPLRCCTELQVYKDLINLSLSDVDTTNDNESDSNESAWWEAEVFVRGFKEKAMKSGDIWTV